MLQIAQPKAKISKYEFTTTTTDFEGNGITCKQIRIDTKK